MVCVDGNLFIIKENFLEFIILARIVLGFVLLFVRITHTKRGKIERGEGKVEKKVKKI